MTTTAGATIATGRAGRRYQSLYDVVYSELLDRIVGGQLAPGDRLVESRIAEEFDVSKIPVREALRTLAADGFVSIEPRKGASVALLSDEKARDLVEVRASLEALNARLATQRRTANDVLELTKLLDEGTAASDSGDLSACAKLNRVFHETLNGMTGNAFLQTLMLSLRNRTNVAFLTNDPDRIQQSWIEHAGILRAVINRDVVTAEHAASQHIHSAAAFYFERRHS